MINELATSFLFFALVVRVRLKRKAEACSSVPTENPVEFFAKNGYLVIPSYLDRATLDALSAQVQGAIADKTKKVKAVPFRALSDAKVFQDLRDSSFTVELFGTSAQLVDTVGHGFHFDPSSNPAKQVATSERVASLCRTLVGMKDPRIVQTKFVMKLPKIGAKVPTHADEQYIYSQNPSSPGLALWIPLDSAEAINGALKVVARSHLEIGPGEKFSVDPVRECARWSSAPTSGYAPSRTRGFPYGKKELDALDWTLLPCSPGDCVLMHSALLHASDGNRSNKPRRAFTAHYIDGSDDASWSENECWIPRPKEGFPRVGL